MNRETSANSSRSYERVQEPQHPLEDLFRLLSNSLSMKVSVLSTMTYPDKAAKLGMLEKLGDNDAFKLGWILHDKGFAIFRPSRNCRIAAIYHMVGFYIRIEMKREIQR